MSIRMLRLTRAAAYVLCVIIAAAAIMILFPAAARGHETVTVCHTIDEGVVDVAAEGARKKGKPETLVVTRPEVVANFMAQFNAYPPVSSYDFDAFIVIKDPIVLKEGIVALWFYQNGCYQQATKADAKMVAKFLQLGEGGV